jgi:hypothetical protein
MRTIIHVNQHRIRSNKKNNANEPVITVKDYRSNRYAREVIIHGTCRVVYRPHAPLSCGARCWVEVADGGQVEIIL